MKKQFAVLVLPSATSAAANAIKREQAYYRLLGYHVPSHLSGHLLEDYITGQRQFNRLN